MLIFDPWTPKRAAGYPLSKETVQMVLEGLHCSLWLHLGLGIAAAAVLGWIVDTSTGPAANVFGVIAALVLLYDIACSASIYEFYKVRKYVLRDYPLYLDREDGAALLWRIHRNIFPMPWK